MSVKAYSFGTLDPGPLGRPSIDDDGVRQSKRPRRWGAAVVGEAVLIHLGRTYGSTPGSGTSSCPATGSWADPRS